MAARPAPLGHNIWLSRRVQCSGGGKTCLAENSGSSPHSSPFENTLCCRSSAEADGPTKMVFNEVVS